MTSTRSVKPTDFLIDANNPRLPLPNSGQRDAIRELAKLPGKKLLALAWHIVEHGLNPSEMPIVMPAGDDTQRVIVLQGNRRIVALKALESPESIAE